MPLADVLIVSRSVERSRRRSCSRGLVWVVARLLGLLPVECKY